MNMKGSVLVAAIALPRLLPCPLGLPGRLPISAPRTILPGSDKFNYPLSLPSSRAQMPAVQAPTLAPSAAIRLPGQAVRVVPLLAADPADADEKTVERVKERLDKGFDGKNVPVVKIVPVAPERRVTVPEWDLERELGL